MQVIKKQSGAAFKLKKGQKLKVIDAEGEQVSDMVLFNAKDRREKLSSGKTLDFEESILISSGNKKRKCGRFIQKDISICTVQHS